MVLVDGLSLSDLCSGLAQERECISLCLSPCVPDNDSLFAAGSRPGEPLPRP